MVTTNYAESWKDVYNTENSVVNFVAGDFNSLKDVIRQYIVMQNPENYNDWAESSEVGMFANGIAYLGETLHYRVDLNAHDNFPVTTERRQSLLNFTKMLSYSPKRNICANGIAKLNYVSTTQSVKDTSGRVLKDMKIYWNDSSNKDWLEQFLTVMNASFVANNPYGKPLKNEVVDNITTQMYEFNNVVNTQGVYSFTTYVNSTTQQFEIVNPDIDTALNVIYERTPKPESSFHILYRNDGTGNASKNTGFFLYWKQGSLQSLYKNFTQKIENNSVEIDVKNINEYDVWVQEVDSSTGLVKNNWTKIANDEYLSYNNTDASIRNVFKVETRENDTVIVRFSDGKFGTIPVGLFRIWYRVSQGNSNLYIKPSDIKNISIKVPYKSNNTTDDNVYYLTMNFSVADISHIRQSVPQESMEEIRERGPQVYSTQNRMVTGQDYNYFPKSIGQQLKTVKAINRTYAGNSRYVKFNDPTGNYQDLSVLAEDGYIYKKNSEPTIEVAINSLTESRDVIIRNILPLLNNKGLSNYYYEKTDPYILSNDDKQWKWKERYSEGSNTSYGILVDKDGVELGYEEIKDNIFIGSFIKCVKSLDGNVEEKWITVCDINVDRNTSTYSITIDDSLGDGEWVFEETYYPFITSMSSLPINEMINAMDNGTSYRLSYVKNEDNDKFSWKYTESDSSNDDGTWFVDVKYSDNPSWCISVKHLDYIFGSKSKVAFFFNTNEKTDSGFYTKDYIKVLQVNDMNYKGDFYWKPTDVIKYNDGYTDTRQVIVYGYDSDKDASIDNPMQFKDIVGENDELYFMRTDDMEMDSLNTDVKVIDSLWDKGVTSTSGYYFCKTSGTIYTAGTVIPHDIIVEDRNITLSNGDLITPSNPLNAKAGEIYDYDIVDEGHDENHNEINGSELVYWDAKNGKMTRFTKDEWYTEKGKSNIKFIWQHYASSNYVIDPCPTNIIDIYTLTTDYYNKVKTWVLNGKKEAFPKLPSSYELKSMFSELEKYNMVSDTIVWHPVKYKLLFGNQADDMFKANFRVIKNSNSTMSDNEIKQKVIEAIDEFFEKMEAGQKFFFTKLASHIDSKLQSNIGTVVIVPAYSDDKFGNLFEINCEEDEIMLSSATIENVQIINKITNHNIRIGE